ncbi:MAG: argininosuccinate lyase [Alkaliphilus sp.]|nr:MAG: argininosuccinate lyase [Alkaliphilus sp.]
MVKLWAGRFKEESSTLFDEFNESISFDKKLYKEDIRGSIAHCKMLNKINILTDKESEKIQNCLKKIESLIEEGKLEFSIENEDIHMNIESLLIDEIGELGKKLHSGRSRNDQIAIDLRMFLLEKTNLIMDCILSLLNILLNISEKNKKIILPGYTHLQKAQPIRLSFYFMAYFQMLRRDYERFEDSLKRTNSMVLGSGALSGVPYKLDREFLRDELNFLYISENALDSVSDRDFIIEFQSNSSILMMHLSRLSEEMILWATSEFNFIEISDKHTTGSSIMPQKKNPDVFELIRGKTGRVYGNLISILTVMKGLPLAYNKDMQEDKESLFDSVVTVERSLKILSEMMPEIKFNSQRMSNSLKSGFLNATDMADYLVSKGMEFRNAHKLVGELVSYSLDNNKSLEELELNELKAFSKLFDDEIYNRLSFENSIESKISFGSSSIENVEKSFLSAKKFFLDKRK